MARILLYAVLSTGKSNTRKVVIKWKLLQNSIKTESWSQSKTIGRQIFC